MSCKTGAEHIKSLQDGRTVYIDGKLVGDVTVHPAFRNSVKSAAMLYDFQAQPENIELMTFQPNGANRRVNRAWQMPRNYAEMVQRRKAMQAWAQLSCGFMGRSPDHLASSVVGQVMGIEVFEKHGPARAKALQRLLRGSEPQRLVPHLCDHQSAGRARQGLGRAGRGPGRAHRRRGRRRHHDPRRQDARHLVDHGERGVRRQPAAAESRRGGARLLLRAADERQGPARAVAQVLRGGRRLGVRQSALVALRRERRADLFRRREGAVGARVRAPRPRHVPRPVPRHAGPRLPELPGADPPLGEDQVPVRARAPHHRGDRHHQHAAGARAARLPRRAGQHGQRHDGRHGGRRHDARRMVRAEPALHVFGAGADPGPLSEGDQHAARPVRRRADHAAVLDPRFRRPAARAGSSTRRSAPPR